MTADPIPMLLVCPSCGKRHIDRDEFATKPHHTHACQYCGMCWRPAVVSTVGVEFLPGFKDAAPLPRRLIDDPELRELWKLAERKWLMALHGPRIFDTLMTKVEQAIGPAAPPAAAPKPKRFADIVDVEPVTYEIAIDTTTSSGEILRGTVTLCAPFVLQGVQVVECDAGDYRTLHQIYDGVLRSIRIGTREFLTLPSPLKAIGEVFYGRFDDEWMSAGLRCEAEVMIDRSRARQVVLVRLHGKQPTIRRDGAS